MTGVTLRVLLTGFEPFGPHAVNPSRELLGPLRADPPDGTDIVTRVLPVSYRDAFEPVRRALAVERFDVVALMGLAADAGGIRFERVARNRRAGTLPDNDGVVIDGAPIDPAGPEACIATADVDGMAAACADVGVPAIVSTDAGRFLCNQILYQTLLHGVRFGMPARTTFIHLPQADEHAEAGQPSLPFEALLRGVRAALSRLAASPGRGGL